MKQTEFTAYIDDQDIDNFDMKLVRYEIQSYTKRKNVGTDIPGAHGTQAVPSTLSSSGFVMTVVCTGTDVDDVNTKIREFFVFMYSTMDPRKVVFSDDESIIRYAILDAPEKYKVISGVDNAFAELKLTFYMGDPFMYSNELSRVVNEAVHGKGVYVVNEGFECPALFTLENRQTVTVSSPSLVVNDEVVGFLCDLEPGDIIVLDTDEYEVRVNGEVHLEYWSGEMPMLKNGNNVITQQNADEKTLLLTVEFRKQWV